MGMKSDWEPQVGDGVTWTIYTDSHAATVIKRTPTRVTVQQDKATLLNGVDSGEPDALRFSPGGFCGHTSGYQRYHYERDPNGKVLVFSKRKLGSRGHIWVLSGHPTRSPGYKLTEGRHEHYDFNF